MPKASIELELRTQKLKQGSREAVQSFSQIEQKGRQSMQTVDTHVNNTTNNMARLEQQSNKTAFSLSRNGTAMLAIGTSYAGAYTAISNLDKAMQRVAKAELGLQRARDLEKTTIISIQRLESQLSKLRSEGKTNTDAFTLAQAKLELQTQKLTTAQNDLLVKEEELRIQQGALTDTQILFSTMMINTVVSSVALGRQAFEGLSKAQFLSKIQALTSIPVYKNNALANMMMGKASIFSIKGLKALMTTQKLLNLSMGKWLLIATGVILAYEGIAHVIKMMNPEIDITIEKLGGDLMVAMDKAQMKAMGMSDDMVVATEDIEQMGNTADITSTQMETFVAQTVASSGALQGLTTEYGKTSEAITKFHDELAGEGLEQAKARAEALELTFKAVTDGINKDSEEWKRAVHSIIPEIQKVADELAISSKDGAIAFVNNIKDMTGSTSGQFDKIIDKINQVDKALERVNQKKTRNSVTLDNIDEQLNSNRNLAYIRELFETADYHYRQGNLEEAMVWEKYANRLGRMTPSISGKIRSMEFQISQINSVFGRSVINVGGAVNFDLKGMSYQDLLDRGVAKHTRSFSNASIRASGLSKAGFISAKLSGVSNPKSVSRGGRQAKGRSSKHGGANLSRRFRARAKWQKMTGGDDHRMLLEKLTGINLDLPVDQKGGRGWSGRKHYRFDILGQRLSEANSRLSLVEQIGDLGAFDSDTIELLRQRYPARNSSKFLREFLESETEQIERNAETLGLTKQQIIQKRSSQLSANDVANMIAFTELEKMTMNQV